MEAAAKLLQPMPLLPIACIPATALAYAVPGADCPKTICYKGIAGTICKGMAWFTSRTPGQKDIGQKAIVFGSFF